MKGKFIVLEGLDGSGKTTQAKLLKEYLESKGMKVYLTSEPSEGPAGKLLREVMSHNDENEKPLIAGLYVADRLDHIHNKNNGLLVKLKEGCTVLCDRYYLSSLAYQGMDYGLKWVYEANRLAIETLKPDLTLFLDLPAHEAYSRRVKSGSERECFEKEEILEKVNNYYNIAINKLQDKENIFRVGADKKQDEVLKSIIKEVEKILEF